MQGEVPWESPWDCPLQREAPWQLHQMRCEIAWGVALQWPCLGSGHAVANCLLEAHWGVAWGCEPH